MSWFYMVGFDLGLLYFDVQLVHCTMYYALTLLSRMRRENEKSNKDNPMVESSRNILT